MKGLLKLYHKLLKEYGPQGWWPLLRLPARYHPSDYSLPRTSKERFEICAGAILTQNTAWKNAERALEGLSKKGLLSPERLLRAGREAVEEAIRPSGYYAQKARKLREFARFYKELRGRTPPREALLSLWGIGPETADSILLYAYKEPRFVIDAYTRRVLASEGLLPPAEAKRLSYEELQLLFEEALPRSVPPYQEYHALLVRRAKELAKR